MFGRARPSAGLLLDCLDILLMTKIVPAVPIAFFQATTLLSPSVTAYSWDAATQMPALDRIGVVAT